MSIQDIRQNPQDTSNFYLANIYQTLADSSQSNISSALPASPPPFSPPTYAVWVNTLWFLSLVISLTCALLATLLQQWARRYLKVTQSRYSLHKRARIRAFLAEGVENFLLPWTVETLPTLLHISLFLFFTVLVVFLWNVNLTAFKLVLSWVAVCMSLYGCTTLVPVFRHDSPYHTPLTLPAWHIVTGVSLVTFRALRRLTRFDYFSWETHHRFRCLDERYGKWLVQGMQKTIEETASNSPSEIDTRAFLWTFNCLDEDHELERFFSGLPSFRSSKVVDDPLPGLTEDQMLKLSSALLGLLDRTFSSDLLPVPVKERRAMLCAKVTDPAHIPLAFGVLDRILSSYQDSDPLVAEILQIVRGWDNSRDEKTILVAQATVSSIVARAHQRDDPWFTLASNELGLPESVLRDYAANGDSLSLAILIHITRQLFSCYGNPSWLQCGIWSFSKVLEAASKFNVQDTSPKLQHEFCTLWNQIVLKVQNNDDQWMAFEILGRIRNVYMVLHRDTDSAPTQFSASTGNKDDILLDPYSYPVCNIPGHHPDSIPHIHNVSASTTFASVVPHDHGNTALVSSFLAGSPDTPPSSAHVPLLVNESITDAAPLDNNISVSVSLQPVDQTPTTTESCRIPIASLNPVTTHATQGSIDASARTMYPATPELELSVSIPPPKSKPGASTSPPDAVAIEQTAVSPTPSLDAPSSPSPSRILDDMLPTDPPSTSSTPVIGSYHASSSESHSSMPLVAPGAPAPLASRP